MTDAFSIETDPNASRQNDARAREIANDGRADGMADLNRIQKELREIASDAASGVTVTQHGDSLTHMKGTISGASRKGHQID